MTRTTREFAIVALALTGLSAALYAPNAIHGGFISDAWSNRALFHFSPDGGFFGALDHFLAQPNIAVRPVLAVYLVALNEAFGSHMGLWLTWLVATNVVMALILYLLLRRLSLSWLDSGMIAGLLLVFPATSSMRLWAAMGGAPVTISLALVGFLLALLAFEATSRRNSFLLHAGSLTLFAASLLLYETMLPLMLSSVLLYRLRVPLKAAATRWAADCFVLLTLTLTVTRSSNSGFAQSTTGMWEHATEIYSQTRVLLTTVILPLSSASWYVLLLLALVPIVAYLVSSTLAPLDPIREALRRWLVVLAAGMVVAAVSYTIFIPGLDYYIPLGAGIANRVNAVPSIGWVIVLYAGAMLVAILGLQRLPNGLARAPWLAALICILIAIRWLGSIVDESHAYTDAYREDVRVLSVIKSSVPNPKPYSTIWTFGQPVEIMPGIPVFGNTWDMTTSVQLAYDDPTLKSYVAFPGTTFACSGDGVIPGGPYASERAAASSTYGRTYLVETTTGRFELIATTAQCRRAVQAFPPSPSLPVE